MWNATVLCITNGKLGVDLIGRTVHASVYRRAFKVYGNSHGPLPEKNRVTGKRSNRTALVTPKLAESLQEWLMVRPESPFLFCQAQRVTRSQTKRKGPTAITKGQIMEVHRITVVFDKPTRDGDRDIHILTNLPAKKVAAVRVAEVYRKR